MSKALKAVAQGCEAYPILSNISYVANIIAGEMSCDPTATFYINGIDRLDSRCIDRHFCAAHLVAKWNGAIEFKVFKETLGRPMGQPMPIVVAYDCRI